MTKDVDFIKYACQNTVRGVRDRLFAIGYI
jgi:hypothetical protein